MRTNGNFIEVDFFQNNKAGNIVCGDCFMSKKLKEEARVISVLSDGLGSGIKANVLSTMTASMAMNFSVMNEDLVAASSTIIGTLPKDKVKKISYSTFCICDIDFFGNVKIVEYETPSFLLYRKGMFVNVYKEKIPVERKDMDKTFLWISEFTMQPEDRIIFYSDGVTQSGIGGRGLPMGWGDNGVKEYVTNIIARTEDMSAAELSRRIVAEAEKNDGFSVKDDTSCCVVYMRNPRNLIICTGPPYDEVNDKYLAKQVEEFPGKKIICGGTTAQIISREWDTPIKHDAGKLEDGLPPSSEMKGADLITEGILTLSKVEQMLSENDHSTTKDGQAEQIVKYLKNSDKITFLVGTRINEAHQDPNLPVELEIRRNVVKKVKDLLEKKYLKDVEIKYI